MSAEHEPVPTLPPPDPPSLPPRITVVHVLYHQSPDQDAKGVESRYTRILNQDEQPYQRQTRIEERWTRLDTGWIASPGIVVLENRGTQFRVNPTEAERKAAEAKSLIVGVRPALFDEADPVPFACVPPGESLTLTPVPGSSLLLRCAAGSVAVTVNAFPS